MWNKISAVIMLLVATMAVANKTSAAPTPVEKTIPVLLQLQWASPTQFAGYYIAHYQGYYKDEGLDVSIKAANNNIAPHTVLAQGGADFAVSWLPKVLADPQTNANLINIAQVFQRSATLQIAWKDSGIVKPEDWRGKKIGAWDLGNELELYAAMHKVGIDPANKKDVTIVKQSLDMSEFLDHRLDAVQGMSYNEYYQILAAKNPKTGRHYQASDLTTVDFDDPSVGTAMLQDGIYVRKDWLKNPHNQQTAVKFLRASFRGWIYCRDHFQDCENLLLKNNKNLDKRYLMWQLNEVNDLVWPSPKGIGIMDPAFFLQTVKIMLDYQLINHYPKNETYRTDLAEQALAGLKNAETKGIAYYKKKL